MYFHPVSFAYKPHENSKRKKNSFDKGTRRQKKNAHDTRGRQKSRNKKLKLTPKLESRNKIKEKVIKLFDYLKKKNRKDSSSSSSSVANKYEKGKKYITKK